MSNISLHVVIAFLSLQKNQQPTLIEMRHKIQHLNAFIFQLCQTKLKLNEGRWTATALPAMTRYIIPDFHSR